MVNTTVVKLGHKIRLQQCALFLTFLSHHQVNLNCLVKGRGVRVEGKLALHDTLVQAAVIQRDINNADGDILQVFTAIPRQTTLPWPLCLLWSAIKSVDLMDGEMSLLINPHAERVN